MADKGVPLLSVEGLSVSMNTEDGRIVLIDDVSFALRRGEVLGLVGESGCGKSVTAQTIMRLLPMPPARIERGRIELEGRDLVGLSEAGMRALRGDRMAMIFQEPMTSLNPTMTVGRQVAEVLTLHRGASAAEARRTATAMLDQVGIAEPGRRLGQFPHELSGGMRQRVMIAMALVCRPAVLIADEPTTALDVTIQAQILSLLRRLKDEFGLAILLITHDLGVVAEMCDRVVVMYAGRVVEHGSAQRVLGHPSHPYTAGLLTSSRRKDARGRRLPVIPGMVPSPGSWGDACRFSDRCARALPRCRTELPRLAPVAGGGAAACWNPVP
jgi:oligopeptide/dipeptide ABC transporter ATP-binding protein